VDLDHRAAEQREPVPVSAPARLPADEVTLEEHVRELVDGFPPLTAEQRAKLSVLLRENGDAAARTRP